MEKVVRSLIFTLVLGFLFPSEMVFAGSHAPIPPAPYYRAYRYARPVCPIGVGGPGCFAPVRKSVRFVGRVGVVATRAVGRVAVGAVRVVGRTAVASARAVGRVAVGAVRGVGAVVRGTGRLLFGRRFY